MVVEFEGVTPWAYASSSLGDLVAHEQEAFERQDAIAAIENSIEETCI